VKVNLGIFHVLSNYKYSNADDMPNPDSEASIEDLVNIVTATRTNPDISVVGSPEANVHLKCRIYGQIVNVDKLKLLGGVQQSVMDSKSWAINVRA
jgi:hypothetical protein